MRSWLVAQAIGDATDAAVFALGARTGQLPRVRAGALAAFAGSGVLGGLALIRDVDRPKPDRARDRPKPDRARDRPKPD